MWYQQKDKKIDEIRVQKQTHTNMATWSSTKLYEQFNKEKMVFSTNDVGITGHSYVKEKKNKPQPIPHALYKNLFKMDHKCKTWSYQNFKRNLGSPGLAREFLNTPPKARSIKEKTDQMPLQN